jgi:O-antigen ligase
VTSATATAGRFESRSRSSAYDGSRVLEVLLFATAFVITFSKIRIQVAGDIDFYISDLTAALFVAGFLGHRIARRDWIVSRTVAIAACFFVAFLVVYLIGFYNLETTIDRNLFIKGISKFGIHFALLLCAVAYLERRTPRVYWQTLAAFVAGFAANAAWGFVQLVLAEAGTNLDQKILGPLGLYEKGGINVFGVVGESNIYRTTGLTFDANHLGVMLVVPLLLVFPIYLRLERGHRLRLPVGALLAFLALVELSTLSRSGLLGIAVGLCVLAVPYRHLFLKPRFLVPLGALVAVVAAIVMQRSGFFHAVFTARTQVGGSSAQTHLELYTLIRPALDQHLFFGLGLNTFAAYYEFLTGRTNFGPHSFYVALLTEGGLVGAALYAAWLLFLFRCLRTVRRFGRELARAGDRSAARVRPLGWGLTAALAGTLASNLFYLTMQMYYFTVFAALVVAAPVVFSRAARR